MTRPTAFATSRRRTLHRSPTPLVQATVLTVLLVGCAGNKSPADPVTELTRELLIFQSDVHKDLADERQRLDARQATLDAESRLIAAQRHRDPVIAASIIQIGTVLASMLPVVVLVLVSGSPPAATARRPRRARSSSWRFRATPKSRCGCSPAVRLRRHRCCRPPIRRPLGPTMSHRTNLSRKMTRRSDGFARSRVAFPARHEPSFHEIRRDPL